MLLKRGWQVKIKYLHTHHDGMAIHKTIGILALISFAYRFTGMLLTSGIVSIAQHLFVHGEAGFRTIEGHEGPWHWTLLSIILHASLSVSALIFKPPVTRSVAQPMIYKEFQLHSITFALRSCSVMLCLYAGAKFAPFRGIFILVAHWSADVITSIYKQGTTMRDMPYPSGLSELIQARLNLFYAFSQILAVVGCFLFGFDGAFLVLFPIQFAAFLLTLVRKSIIDAACWHILYIWALSLAYIYAFAVLPRLKLVELILIGSTAAFLRFRLRANKYLLWVPLCLYTMLECDNRSYFSHCSFEGYHWIVAQIDVSRPSPFDNNTGSTGNVCVT